MPNLAVIGHPVAHSRSPAMQTAALSELGLAGEWTYGALDVAPQDFEAEVAELAAAGEYAGVNVTVPHKEAALAMADEATAAARAIGAANTLTFGAGRIAAANTDAGGLLRSLPGGLAAPSGRALVLGAGGAARAAIWALGHGGEGAPGADGEPTAIEAFQVDVWNRTAERGEAVAAALGARAVAEPDAADYALIVNTTAVGLAGEDPFAHLPIAADSFVPGQVVVDMVYGEEPSPLLAAAAAAAATVVDGLEMLVQQGALSLRIWTGEEPDIAAMRTAARR
ncbi:MAG TPA: shikimate dehydrogenase [Solirubrobacterales bacterium]|nr:shikimate dehydrogenase [Solirubrobacterales bacterium]